MRLYESSKISCIDLCSVTIVGASWSHVTQCVTSEQYSYGTYSKFWLRNL